jgi:hypothetical protein
MSDDGKGKKTKDQTSEPEKEQIVLGVERPDPKRESNSANKDRKTPKR